MEIPLTARAAVLTAFNEPLVIRNDYPVKQAKDLAPGECLVKLEYAGCCHSDLHIQRGDWARKANIPVVLGHEGVGRVVAIGEHSAYTKIKTGDRVGCKWIATSCLNCEMCRKGYEAACSAVASRSHGYQMDGTFADYVISYVDYVTPIPDGLDSASAAPILCAGMTVYKALKQSKATIGDWVAISGAGGGLGHLAIQYAVAMGLRVVAIDTGAEKKKLCLSLGAEKWIDFKEVEDLIKAVQQATDGFGPHAAIIVVSDARPFNQALMYLRSAGTLVAVGMPTSSSTLNVPITLLIAKYHYCRLCTRVGTFSSVEVRNLIQSRNRQEVTEALAIAAQGKVKVHVQERKLEDLNNILSDFQEGRVTGRLVIKL